VRVSRYSLSGRKRRRGVYVLPSFITLANMFVGFFAVINAVGEKYVSAAYLVLVAGFLDMLDGRIARMTKTQTDFGKELDSLSDVVSFGFVPALIVYLYALQPLGRLGWLLAFFYTACGAIRLARFNILSGQQNHSIFVGLPIPMAAGLVVFLILLMPENSPIFPFAVFGAGCLMVSSIPYPSFKQLDVRTMRPTYTMLLMLLILVIIAYKPIQAMFVLLMIYIVIGPVFWLKGKLFPVRNSLNDESKEES